MDKNSELEYLMNPVLYDKYRELSCKEDELLFRNDRQFYKKRISQMARDALREKSNVPSQLIKYYNEFARRCIQHFKCEDETECYQKKLGPCEDFNDVTTISSNSNTDDMKCSNYTTQAAIDYTLLSQQPKKKVVTIDNFVKKTSSKPPVPPIIPKQTQINTKDSKYRTKGLRKKKKEI
jgi:hypothetical protein